MNGVTEIAQNYLNKIADGEDIEKMMSKANYMGIPMNLANFLIHEKMKELMEIENARRKRSIELDNR